MKTYEEMLNEVMSMTDLKKIPGGTAAQRKVAQDRQKAREAKNRGFDAAKKPEPAPEKGGALVKAEPKAIEKKPAGELARKPDLRKSQIGKWSQGIKANPTSTKKGGALAKSDSGKLDKPDTSIKSVDVKDVTEPKEDGTKAPTKKLKKDNTLLRGLRKGLGKGAKLAKGAAKKVLGAKTGTTGVSQSGDLEGLSGRDKGLIG
ncbi:hypothetical protein [Synechococcus phage S-B68]|nr:hypothetical protein [Synechococcus phage S-B68]